MTLKSYILEALVERFNSGPQQNLKLAVSVCRDNPRGLGILRFKRNAGKIIFLQNVLRNRKIISKNYITKQVKNKIVINPSAAIISLNN